MILEMKKSGSKDYHGKSLNQWNFIITLFSLSSSSSSALPRSLVIFAKGTGNGINKRIASPPKRDTN